MAENWNIRVPIKQRIPVRALGFIRKAIKDGNKLFLYYHTERFMAVPHQVNGRHGLTECNGWLEISPVELPDYQTRKWDDLRRIQEQDIHDCLAIQAQQKVLRSAEVNANKDNGGA